MGRNNIWNKEVSKLNFSIALSFKPGYNKKRSFIMNRLTIALLIALVVSSCTSAFAKLTFEKSTNDVLDIEVNLIRNVMADNDSAWGIALKANDYDPSNPDGTDKHSLDTSSVTMQAMGNRAVVLGKVFLQIIPWDIYEVVVYTNNMDLDNDDIPNLPSDWNTKLINQKQDFIDKHAGLQNQNPDYLDTEGFNSNLYGAALKLRSEGIHSSSAKDTLINTPEKMPTWVSTGFTGTVNETVPAELWNSDYASVEFSPVPELANEIHSADLPVTSDGPAGLVTIAGAMKSSPLKNDDDTENWLEVIIAASEKNTGSGSHSTRVYFELRWN